ncbi:MAG: acyl carrier protein [Proteobacteria bacterium]|nr:acyl carrier protein [Pseudomonadota bacterium]
MIQSNDPLITEIKELIINSLELEDISTDEIETEAPLFGEGLGLDSIDALELGVVIQKKYNVKFEAGSDDNKQIFASVINLAKYIKHSLEQ